MAGSKPVLADLSQELDELTWSEVTKLGVQLGMEFSVLQKIGDTKADSVRLLAAMNSWLQSDPKASWKKVVRALRAIRKEVLAQELGEKYCRDRGREICFAAGNDGSSAAIVAGEASRSTTQPLSSETATHHLPSDSPPVPPEIMRLQQTPHHMLTSQENEGGLPRTTEKIYIPPCDQKRFNLVGQLLGPKGLTLQRMQAETQTRMTILGRGSIRDKKKEEELRDSGDPAHAHLNEDLHILVEVNGPFSEYKLRAGVAEVRKMLIPTEEGVSDPMAMKQQMYAPVIQRGRGAGGGVGSPRGGGGAFGSPRGRGGWRGTGGRGRGGQGGPVGARGEPGRGRGGMRGGK